MNSELGLLGSGSLINNAKLSSHWSPTTSAPAQAAPDLNGAGIDIDGSQYVNADELSSLEGIWSPDIEQCFREASAIYPPCGRRKIIYVLPDDERKMYGRNELIARYIQLKTGKTRTRKQVSSHIQVLEKKKMRRIQANFKQHAAEAAAAGPATSVWSSSGVPVPRYSSTVSFWSGRFQPSRLSQVVNPFSQVVHTGTTRNDTDNRPDPDFGTTTLGLGPGSVWDDRAIASHKLCLVGLSAFVEQQRRPPDPDTNQKHLFIHITPVSQSDPVLESVDIRQIYDKFPETDGGLKELYDKGPQPQNGSGFFLIKFWADLNFNVQDEVGVGAFYGVSSQYESNENMAITVSTKVCSFGKQVMEKVETEHPRFENNGRFFYRIHKSHMCEHMINFIHQLNRLPETYMMNSVLENFTILQVVSNSLTQETLLCLAYIFEVSAADRGAQHHIYKLVKE